MSDISITILLPNFNHAELIPIALDALVAQTKPADEILVIDDCSTDNSVAVIDAYRARLPQLQLFRNQENMGVNRATNRLLQIARSSHVVCTAADDWLEPQFIARTTQVLRLFPQAPVCISAFVEYDEAKDQIVREGVDSDRGCWFAKDGPEYFTGEALMKLLDERFVWLPVNSAVFDRAALTRLGGFDPALKWHADWFAIYTIALRQGFAVVPEPLTVFRVAPTTFSSRGMHNPAMQREVAMAIYDKLSQPEFLDIRDALRRHPIALTTFMRQLLIGLAGRPRDWPYLVSLLVWWSGEVLHGRRPGAWRNFLVTHGLKRM